MIPLSQYGNMFYSVFCRAVEKTRRTTIVISDDDISQLRRRTVVLNPEVSEPVSQTPYVLEAVSEQLENTSENIPNELGQSSDIFLSKGFFEMARNKLVKLVKSDKIDIMTPKILNTLRSDLEKVFVQNKFYLNFSFKMYFRF